MATKLYLHNAAYAGGGTVPTGEQSAQTAGVTFTGANTLRTMDRTIGVSQSSQAMAELNQTAYQYNFVRMFASPPLLGVTSIGVDTLTLWIADARGHGSRTTFCINTLNCYVWRPSNGSKVGTILDGVAAAIGGSGSSSANTEQVTTFTTGNTTTVNNIQDNDIIVVELWAYFNKSTTTGGPYTNTVYYDGTTDNAAAENTAIASCAAFLQFNTSTLTFSTDPSGPPKFIIESLMLHPSAPFRGI